MTSNITARFFIEEREEQLSPFAVKSRLSRGRQRYEEPCLLRSEFQRDRDRIIHSNSFRRLKHKTQVFIVPTGDHYVTRLTHTLEVSQIARTIARSLNLNEDLVEAISLGHDLGHTPFGHTGEEVLDELLESGFKHYKQSLRVVDVLEKDGRGLNLTWEVRDGILNHSKGQVEIFGAEWGDSNTIEAEVCKLADVIAYINHDIGDGIRAGIISENELPEETLECLGHSSSQRISSLIHDIVQYSWGVSGCGKVKVPRIGMSQPFTTSANLLRRFLIERLYSPSRKTHETTEARAIIKKLFQYYSQHPERLPEVPVVESDLHVRVADYISGMTDQYAIIAFNSI